jgi:hypothetical protein
MMLFHFTCFLKENAIGQKPGFFFSAFCSKQISHSNPVSQINAIGQKPGFFFRAFRSNQISHSNPVSQRKRDRAETGFLVKDFSLKADISHNTFAKPKKRFLWLVDAANPRNALGFAIAQPNLQKWRRYCVKNPVSGYRNRVSLETMPQSSFSGLFSILPSFFQWKQFPLFLHS